MTNPNNDQAVRPAVPEVIEGDTRPDEWADYDESTDPGDLLRVARRLAAELDRSGEYGRALWQQLQALATYLREGIAHADSAAALLDETGRTRWAEHYAATLSLLAGPRGDSGHGREEAQRELQNLDA